MTRPRRLPIGFTIDLIPVMSLIVHIVPMLLLSVRFATLSTLSTGGPVVPTRPATGEDVLEQQESKVVSVRITPDGFVVGGAGLADPRLPCHGVCEPETYDYTALSEAMITAKQRLPEEKRVVVLPDAAVPFEVLVAVMDATAGVGRGGDRRELFPVPLFAADIAAPVAPESP